MNREEDELWLMIQQFETLMIDSWITSSLPLFPFLEMYFLFPKGEIGIIIQRQEIEGEEG